MKGRILIIGLVMICLLLSCGSTANIYDETVPLEKSAVLSIVPQFSIKSYNGIPVKLKTGLGSTGFTIPAGRTTFVFDVDTGRTFGDLRVVGKDFSLTYNFAAGNEYQIMMVFVDKNGDFKASNIGETYLALFICQGKEHDHKNPLYKMTFK